MKQINHYLDEYRDMYQENRDKVDWEEKYQTLMQELNRGVTALGNETGFSKVSVSYIANGKKKPSFAFLSDTVRYLHVNPDWLMQVEVQEVPVLKDDLRKRSEPEKIAERVRVLMDGKSETAFSTDISMNFSTLKYILNGEEVREAVIRRMADRCNASFEWLLCGDESSKEYPCTKKMVSWLEEHPKERKKIFVQMPDAVELQSKKEWDDILQRVEAYNQDPDNDKVDLQEVGHRIFALRQAYNCSLRDLEAITGVSKSSINNWEKGSHLPDAFALRRISETLNISSKWILYGDADSMRWPCDMRMIEFLQGREDLRESVAQKMGRARQ